MQRDMNEPSGDFYPESQSLSPQASTDEKSLHGNWQRNKEILQKRLSIRRPVNELVNNGIMMSPLKTPPCYQEKMRQLERAKTTDILKQKIQHRPDAQSLVDRHILPEWPPDEIGGSPQIFEQQQLMRRNELKSSLSAKLEQRPGSLEMAEKGLLPLAPPMQTLLRDGSIAYPRVDEMVSDTEELDLPGVSGPLLSSLPPVPPVTSVPSCVVTPMMTTMASPEFYPTAPSVAPSVASTTSSTSSCRRSRSRRTGSGPGTSKVGNFVFHTYTPPPKSEPPEPEPVVVTPNTARQIQQAEYLRLQESEDKQNVLMQQLVNDIRARSDGGSPMKVQRSEPGHVQLQPTVTAATSSGFVSFPGLAALNVQQLKEECRRYKVPRTGNKMNLIRNLEPFQQEILRKYMSTTTSPTLGSPAGSQVAMAAGLVTNGLGGCVEDQSMRHSSSAPQLNLAAAVAAGKMGGQVWSEERKSTECSSPQQQGQWQQQQQQQQPATLILLNQAGPMTLQPVLVTPQGMVAATPQPGHPPPPPPAPPATQALLLRHTSQTSTSPEQQPSFAEEPDETELIQRVEDLEKQIVQNIQESDAFKASHNGARDENIERQRQYLMVNYTNTKRHAKLQLQTRVDNFRQRLIELCERETTLNEQHNGEAMALLEREREVTLAEYNRLNGVLDKIKANSTPNTSVSSESRLRSLTEGNSIGVPSVPLNRSITVGEADVSRTMGGMNGSHGESMSVPKHMERRLPSVEFQMLNEVLSQEHVRSKVLRVKPVQIDGNGTGDQSPCDLTTWLNDPSLTQFPSAPIDPTMQAGQSSQQSLMLTSQTPQASHQPHLNGCSINDVDIPMSPMQTDLSSRCSTPQRPPPTEPNPVPQPVMMQTLHGEFNFDDIFSHNMDITFPSLGGHPSAASMTEQILTPNTQNVLFQMIPDVVNMETDNDVFSP